MKDLIDIDRKTHHLINKKEAPPYERGFAFPGN